MKQGRSRSIQKFMFTSVGLLITSVIGLGIYTIVSPTIQSLLFSSDETVIPPIGTVALITGHGYDQSDWYDSGAIAYNEVHEADMTRALAKDLKKSLEALNIKVVVIEDNVFRNMMEFDAQYDFKDYDFVVELHFNASDDASLRGTEIIYNSLITDLSVHESLMDSLKKLSRSVVLYSNDDFLVQRTIALQHIPCMLLETAYIDNRQDYTHYIDNKEAYVSAITESISTLFIVESDTDKSSE